MTQEHIFKILIGWFITLFIAMFISSAVEAYNPGTVSMVQDGWMSRAQVAYIALWQFVISWAWIEAWHDANKILTNKRIYHGWSAIARTAAGIVWCFIMRPWRMMDTVEIIISCILVVFAFTFIFDIRMNVLRGLPPNYFPQKPRIWERFYTLFPDAGNAKMLIQIGMFVGSIIYIFLI